MQNKLITTSVFAAASTTAHASKQGCARVLTSEVSPHQGLLIASGLVATEQDEQGANCVAESMVNYYRTAQNPSIDEAFEKAQTDVANLIAHNFEEAALTETSENSFQSTAMVALETDQHLELGYLGNGGIFHLRGHYGLFLDDYIVPKLFTNYLMPHVGIDSGKLPLYGFIGPDNKHQTPPTLHRISKDNQVYGDILILCSDSIFTEEDRDLGRDRHNQLWKRWPHSLTLLLEHLNSFFEQDLHTTDQLQSSLNDFLAAL
ncbi:MAG: protein phosphatase 2C domain-containing protein, partial [Salibacteraceae bacterium]